MISIASFLLVTFPIISNGLQVFHEMKQSTIYCGVRATDNELIGRVVGGRDAQPGEVPFFASIEESKFFNIFKHKKCGGVLVANRWVLTAAHCTLSWFATLRAILGDKLNNKTIEVEKIYVHPDFNRQTLANDIALLFLKEPAKYNRNIQPLCLPEPGEDETFYGIHGTVAGWGKLDPKEKKLPSNMQVTTLPIIRYDDCRELYRKAGHNKTNIAESMLCAGFSDGGKDACFGDSGGPLMVKIENHWILAGIVSNGISCAKPNLPGIYTRVGFFLDWIKRTVH